MRYPALTRTESEHLANLHRGFGVRTGFMWFLYALLGLLALAFIAPLLLLFF